MPDTERVDWPIPASAGACYAWAVSTHASTQRALFGSNAPKSHNQMSAMTVMASQPAIQNTGAK